jgi:phenylalanine-4-hydroxylase
VQVEGPVLVSRGGVAEGRPFAGQALVATGIDAPVPPGRFRLDLPTGLVLEGLSADGPDVQDLRAWMGKQPLEVPSRCRLLLSRAVPSVAGGPAEPGAWDRSCGATTGFTEGDVEARARARKAAALPAEVAALYDGLRRVRESGRRDPAEADRLREAAGRFPGEWLLREEVDEVIHGG